MQRAIGHAFPGDLGEGKQTFGVYEGKAGFGFASAKWRAGVPMHYAIQVQHYLACTGFSWASVAVFLANFAPIPTHRFEDQRTSPTANYRTKLRLTCLL